MKHFSHFRWFVLGAILLGFALVLAPQLAKPARAATLTIDNFDTTTGKVTATYGGTNPNEASTSTSVAGGVRTLWAKVTNTAGALDVDSNVTDIGWYSSSLSSSAEGTSIIQYDGTSGYASPPAQISSVIDLTQSGSNNAIAIRIVSNDHTGVPLIVRFYSFSGVRQCSTLSFSPPLANPGTPVTVYYPFSLFTACGGGYSAANPSAVDAIEVETDSTATYSTDRSFDFIEATSAPTALDLASFSGRAQGDKVNLKWETGSELNTLGFNVWRKQGKAGWKQLNADMIAAKNPGNISGNKYNFTDANKKAGKTYKYKLQVLSADGSSSWTKILKVSVPK